MALNTEIALRWHASQVILVINHLAPDIPLVGEMLVD